MEETNAIVQQKLKENIKEGRYKLGDIIVPQQFEKMVLKNNKIVKTILTVNGRKIPLRSIREDMFYKNLKFMKLRTDAEIAKLSRDEIICDLLRINEYFDSDKEMETFFLQERLKNFERTRHLMFWHDGSPIASHSHLLMLVSCMYDPALFYTDEEYSAKYHVNKVNIQSLVETPYIYILARCPSTDQQLQYIPERTEDLLKLNESLEINNIKIKDVMRILEPLVFHCH